MMHFMSGRTSIRVLVHYKITRIRTNQSTRTKADSVITSNLSLNFRINSILEHSDEQIEQ